MTEYSFTVLMNNEVPEFKDCNLTQVYDTDIGYDIKAGGSYEIPPGCNNKIYTGLRVHLPSTIGAIIQSRSGLAFKEDIEASNAGVIDSGYHNICWVKLYNHSVNKTKIITKGDKIAQMIFHPNMKHFLNMLNKVLLYHTHHYNGFRIIETSLDDFPSTPRGDNGLGSTGK